MEADTQVETETATETKVETEANKEAHLGSASTWDPLHPRARPNQETVMSVGGTRNGCKRLSVCGKLPDAVEEPPCLVSFPASQ